MTEVAKNTSPINIRVENWNGHKIRFVEVNPGDWWAVLADITKALGLSAKGVKQRLDDEVIFMHHNLQEETAVC